MDKEIEKLEEALKKLSDTVENMVDEKLVDALKKLSDTVENMVDEKLVDALKKLGDRCRELIERINGSSITSTFKELKKKASQSSPKKYGMKLHFKRDRTYAMPTYKYESVGKKNQPYQRRNYGR